MKKEHINIALLIIIPVYFFSKLLFAEITIYVTSEGNDSGRGGIFSKVASIERAIDIAEDYRLAGKKRNIKIQIDEGRYEIQNTIELGEELSGTGSGKLKIIAKNGKEVSFSGGKIIPFEESTEESGGLLKIDLKEQNIDVVEPRAVGFGRPYGEAWTEIFINKQALTLARWPDSSKILIREVIDSGSVPRFGDFSNRGAIFSYSDTRPSLWKSPEEIWISGYFMYGYAEDAVRLAGIDTIQKTFTTSQPTLYGFGSGKLWQSWYAYNVKEEISTPNEYYLSSEGYILIQDREDISLIEVSVLEGPIMAIENVSDVTIDGIIFECSRGMGVYMENSISCVIQNCTFRNLGSVAVSIGKGIEPFDKLIHEAEGEPASRLLGSIGQHSYQNTMFNREGGFNNGVLNCTIYNTGGGGVHLGGGDRATLESAGNYVINTTISNFNRIEKSYRAGVDISGVGNVISNCEIFDAPSMAILLHGNNHAINFNNIHDVCSDVDDQGAIYFGRDPSERGNIIFYNYFHDIGNHLRTTSVYLDDGACGTEVFGNVFYRAGTIPVLIGGGSDNSFTNNLFVDCDLGIHVDNRLQNWAKSSLDKDGIYDKRLKAVNYTNPPYSEKYPELVNYWIDDPALPKRNIVETNVFVNVEKQYRWNLDWLELGDNLSLDTDPGFVDYGIDFSLKNGSDIFEILPDFMNIPFGKIGTQK